jgi:hypothetical protein
VLARNDGVLSGYRWGTARKRLLLERETRLTPAPLRLRDLSPQPPPPSRRGVVGIAKPTRKSAVIVLSASPFT